MNYLVIEGFKSAAQKFTQEANIDAEMNLETIQDRMSIRNAVQNGDIEGAIEVFGFDKQVNDLDPEILDTHPKLFFHLQQQRLIELIRAGKLEDAIAFAQDELAPRGEEHVRIFFDRTLVR